MQHISDTGDSILAAVVLVGLLLVFFAAAAYVRGMRG